MPPAQVILSLSLGTDLCQVLLGSTEPEAERNPNALHVWFSSVPTSTTRSCNFGSFANQPIYLIFLQPTSRQLHIHQPQGSLSHGSVGLATTTAPSPATHHHPRSHFKRVTSLTFREMKNKRRFHT